MNTTKLLAAALLAGLASLPQVAQAQQAQSGWYAGLDVGKSEADAQITEFVFGMPAVESSGSGTGYRLRVGYQFWRYIAAEVGYADFGDFEYDFDPEFCPIGVPEPCPFSARTSIAGFVSNVVGRIPLGDRWSIHGRLGWFSLRVKNSELGPGGTEDSANHAGLQYGLGAGYRLTDHWEVELDFTRYEQLDVGLTFGGGVGVFDFGDTQLTSLGVNYRW